MGQWSKVDGKWVELVVHTRLIVEVCAYDEDVRELMDDEPQRHCAVLDEAIERGAATRERWMWNSHVHEHAAWLVGLGWLDGEGGGYEGFGASMMRAVMAQVVNQDEQNDIACMIVKNLADMGAVVNVPEYGMLAMVEELRDGDAWRNMNDDEALWDDMEQAYVEQGLDQIAREIGEG